MADLSRLWSDFQFANCSLSSRFVEQLLLMLIDLDVTDLSDDQLSDCLYFIVVVLDFAYKSDYLTLVNRNIDALLRSLVIWVGSTRSGAVATDISLADYHHTRLLTATCLLLKFLQSRFTLNLTDLGALLRSKLQLISPAEGSVMVTVPANVYHLAVISHELGRRWGGGGHFGQSLLGQPLPPP